MSAYLSVQLLLAVLWIGALALLRIPMSRRAALTVVRAGLAAAIVAPLAATLVPESPAWRPEPQVFSETLASGAVALRLAADTPALVLPSGSGTAALVALAAFLSLAAVWAALCVLTLRRALRDTTLLRRIGRLELRLGDRSFAAWRPGRRYIVLERGLLTRHRDHRLALAHELQHHRHGDPRIAWFLLALRTTCFWNPFAHLLARRIAELEELACDEAVVSRTNVSAREYGGCLLRAAASPPLPMAAGLHHPTLLRRRIQMLTSPPAPRRLLAVPFALGLSLTLFGTAWAASGLVETRTVDAEQRVAVSAAASDETFVVRDHAAIAGALDRIVNRPKTAAFFAGGLDKRAEWAELVDGALARYDLPPQLAAVPLVESGYANLGEYKEGLSAAPGVPGKGLWMFIPATARRYGLQVDDTTDERLDPVKETDAAMRLLSDLYAEFGDWGLALAGYNQGARAVRTAIETEGTRDVLTLSERGALNHYVPMVMTSVLLLEDPSLLDAESTPGEQ
ncbi:MAG: transglycosylase SLT domain-containing protein [Deltaproteobacteria bacterium]|nr:transglycosylase SLT domain-containing protein [Deltaproteobacteria bacterium]